MSEVCVVITNYEFSKNADYLKSEFSKYFDTYLIDAQSSTSPTKVDLSIENGYYPALWNSALKYANSKNFSWLMFIASDVVIDDIPKLCIYVSQAINLENVGIYTPSLRNDSRTSFENLYTKPTNSMRECGVVEGFFFLARLNLLNNIYPIDKSIRFGWGIDVLSCFISYQNEKIVIVDDRIEIYHPRNLDNHQIDNLYALREAQDFLGPNIINWSNQKQVSLQNKLNIISTQSNLDLGCGSNISNPFNLRNLYGIDIIPNKNPNIFQADLNIEPIPFPDNFFDTVSAFDFIEHIPRILYCPQRRHPFVELMNEIFRVLKPDGLFFSKTPAYPNSQAFQDPTHVNIITENTFEYYFCNQSPWARMYGYYGNFKVISQKWDNGKLLTLMQCIK